MQYWDDVLYPPFRSTIRGELYGIITHDMMDEICFNLAEQAVCSFKFPKISTEYTVFYAKRNGKDELVETDENDEDAILHAYFDNDLTRAEILVIQAWMKYYWAEMLVSNADNFEDMYTDANIKTFSRANAVSQNRQLMADLRENARELENRYSRVNSSLTPALGDINEDEQ